MLNITDIMISSREDKEADIKTLIVSLQLKILMVSSLSKEEVRNMVMEYNYHLYLRMLKTL